MDGEIIALIISMGGALVYTNKMLVDTIARKLDEVRDEIKDMKIVLERAISHERG